MHPSREAFWYSFVSPYVSLKATETRIPMRVVKGDFVAKGSFDVSVPLSSLYTYMFAGLCASLAGVASQAGDADSSRAPGLTSGSWTEPGVLACTLQFTVILKNPAKCLWRWEPDRRNNFFGPPAHLCRHMWLKYRCISVTVRWRPKSEIWASVPLFCNDKSKPNCASQLLPRSFAAKIWGQWAGNRYKPTWDTLFVTYLAFLLLKLKY